MSRGCAGAAVLATILVGCSGPDFELQPGTYRYSIADYSYWNIGRRIDAEADGKFSGRTDDELWTCVGRLTHVDAVEITDAFNRANVGAHDDVPDECVDGGEYAVSVEVVSGPDAGYEHAFYVGPCGSLPSSLRQALARGLAPLESADCNHCPTETVADQCYGHSVGVERFCLGDAWQVCAAPSAGAVIDCTDAYTGDSSLECEPDDGWVPAIVLSLESATMTRQREMGSTHVFFALDIDVDNRGAAAFDVHDSVDSLRIVDPATDTEVEPPIFALSVVSAPGRTHDVYAVTTSGSVVSGSWWDTVPALRASLPARPYDEAAPGPTVDVVIVDAP